MAEAPRAGASDVRSPAQWRDSQPDEGPLPTRGPRVAFAAPFAHALYVFLGVVAVAVAVAKGGREKTPSLPPTLSHSAEMPSSRVASEILYVVCLFSPMSSR
jgi:hypothetical protein